jgi:hypothetical protein
MAMRITRRSSLFLFAITAMLWWAAQGGVPGPASEDLLRVGLQVAAPSATTVLKVCHRHRRCGKPQGVCMAGCVAGCHAAGAIVPREAIVLPFASATIGEAVTPALQGHRWRPDPPPPRPSIIV